MKMKLLPKFIISLAILAIVLAVVVIALIIRLLRTKGQNA